MFAGLSAFPLTPIDERGIDEVAFVGLVARLAEAGVEAPAPPTAEATTRIAQLRELIGAAAVVGVSGDSRAAVSVLAGAPAWFSVIGGLLPEAALTITRAARAGGRRRLEQTLTTLASR